jgi:hypothetical protein
MLTEEEKQQRETNQKQRKQSHLNKLMNAEVKPITLSHTQGGKE